ALGVQQYAANATVDCAARRITFHAYDPDTGLVVVGGSRNHSGHCGQSTAYQCATVYSDGVLIGNINIACYDLDSAGGVIGSDESQWMTDFFCGNYISEADYDCTHTVNGA